MPINVTIPTVQLACLVQDELTLETFKDESMNALKAEKRALETQDQENRANFVKDILNTKGPDPKDAYWKAFGNGMKNSFAQQKCDTRIQMIEESVLGQYLRTMEVFR